MSEVILELCELQKYFRSYWTFRPIRALEAVSLCVTRGEAFGFLGHNGAGKTTTIKCITGLIHATAGEIRLNGQPLTRPEQRSILGYLPEQPYFYDHLSVYETLEFFAGLAGVERRIRRARVAETLDEVGLTTRAKAPVRSLSKGLQQRLGLAQAIVNKPELLLLDEPFSGLDPLGRIEVRELLLRLRATGTTIFMSSHILSDVQDICDRVAIMAQGKLRKVFDLDETSILFGERYIVECTGLDPAAFNDAAVTTKRETSKHTIIHAEYTEQQQAEAALQRIISSGGTVLSYRHAAPSLEEVFIRTTEDADKENSAELPRAHRGAALVSEETRP